jgi:uncharacterized phage protein gp47/JayE
MITRVSTLEELKQIFVEILINKTAKVTKIADNSVLGGIAFGAAKVGQKALKDIAIVESHMFPDSAFGAYLDTVASNYGIAARFGLAQSSTYLRLVADPGTIYLAGTHKFSGNHGLVFDLESNVTIGVNGFEYVKVRSVDSGEKVNIDALTISTVDPIPVGHLYVTNEYRAIGGRDIEGDEDFRIRIKDGANLAATGTLAKITHVFQKINSNVLKCFYQGIDPLGKATIAIATVNGIDLNSTELDALLNEGQDYFNLTELSQWGAQSIQVVLKNVIWQPIDVSFRVELFANYNPDDVRKNIQNAISKYLDFRYWKPYQKVEWDELLSIVKRVSGVKYVPDATFVPSLDIIVDVNKLPRLRGFLMLDTQGNILQNISGTLNPVYYPNQPDFSYQNTLLTVI